MIAASLAGGGAERAMLDTAALLEARRHHVTILTFEDEASDAYRLPGGLVRVALGVQGHSGNRLRGMRNNIRRMMRLRSEVQRLRPDVVVSYLTRTNILCQLALLGTGRPVVATEHNVATLNDAPMQALWRALRRLVYPYMAQVVVVSAGLAQQYAWLRPDKLSIIHNFLPADRGTDPETFGFLSPGTRYIVGMGRLEPEKGFDRLIKAYQLIAHDCPGWNLLIAGEGSLRPELTRLVAALGLEDRVALPGRVENPRSLFKQCCMFVLSSESEGFGLVLVEAMSAGLPVVSFDCDFGPREIITPGVSGILVPAGDVPALSRSIRDLVHHDAMRLRLAKGGLAAAARFAPHEIINRWEAVLRRAADRVIALREAPPSAQIAEK